MIYVKARRMHAATLTDFVQLSPPHDHVIELMPPSRTRVHPCDFGAHGASKIRVCKTEIEGRALLKQTLTIFVQVPQSMRTKCSGVAIPEIWGGPKNLMGQNVLF